MGAKQLQELADSLNYLDERVKRLDCNYFADEVTLTYGDNGRSVIYNFTGCYKVVFEHVKQYDKPVPSKDLSIPQIPYFLQDVEISSLFEDNIEFYVCKINLFPLNMEIWCKQLKIVEEDTKNA